MTGRTMSFRSLATLAAALVAGLFVATGFADARPGGGKSVGSRGERTFTAPPATNTAPNVAKPMDRTMTQPGAATAQAGQTAATAAAAQAARPSMMKNLLMGGLIGAGLATMFGMGGGLAGVLGFILQGLLIGGLIMLALSFFRNRMGGPALAKASTTAGSGTQNQAGMQRQAVDIGGGGGAPALQVTGDDFNVFEQRLGEIQTAYGRGDIDALGRVATPEMLSYFAGELDQNRKLGHTNEVSQPKLLQGDLSEAWRQANAEYASVAMRYAIIDATVDGAGRVVSGSRTAPSEVTEVWTFMRPRNGRPAQWELSAIQQA